MRFRRLLTLTVLFLAVPTAARAQFLRGRIIDSTSKLPVAGAVLTVLDARGEVLARTVSMDRGIFTTNVPPAATRLRVVRIGFRPREFAVANRTADLPSGGIAMLRLPTMLEPAKVVDDSRCPRRSDQAIAYGLWEQARLGLLASVVAREKDPPDIVRVGYRRTMEGVSSRIRRMEVTRDSSPATAQSFAAARTAIDFVNRGFMRDTEGEESEFFGPDAEVLLDPGFMIGYCFGIRGRDARRPNQVGLSFFAPERKEGRIDVDGTVWIDTSARAIKEIDYRYFGLDRRVEDLRPGGTIGFREMPNGAPFIDRWQLNLVGAHPDTYTVNGALRTNNNKTVFSLTQSGGELAHARWNDGRAFDAPLGKARIWVVNPDSTPAEGVQVLLADTPFHAVIDKLGTFEVRDLVPGPYNLVRVDPRLEAIGYRLPLRLTFNAARDSTFEGTAIAYRLEDQLVRECRRIDGRSQNADSVVLVGRVRDTDNKPVSAANWDIFGPQKRLVGFGRTAHDGYFTICASPARLAKLQSYRLVITRPGLPDAEHQFEIDSRLTVLPVIVPAPPKRR
jgi:hypothetical protein